MMNPLEKQYGPRKAKTKTAKKRITLKKWEKIQRTCMTLLDLARRFPDMARQVCFYPKQSTFHSLVNRVPPSKHKVVRWL